MGITFDPTRSASTITRRFPTGGTTADQLRSFADRAARIRRAICAGNLSIRARRYDWFYVDNTARAQRRRAPAITDGLGKPWIFRQKDIWHFWSQPHYAAGGGSEHGKPDRLGAAIQTHLDHRDWLSGGALRLRTSRAVSFRIPIRPKPCLPYFSSGKRDDLIQRRYARGRARRLRPGLGESPPQSDSVEVYGGAMIAADGIHLWTWTHARFPYSLAATDVWSDAANWETGHWLTGRLGSTPLDGLVSTIWTTAASVTWIRASSATAPTVTSSTGQ